MDDDPIARSEPSQSVVPALTKDFPFAGRDIARAGGLDTDGLTRAYRQTVDKLEKVRASTRERVETLDHLR